MCLQIYEVSSSELQELFTTNWWSFWGTLLGRDRLAKSSYHLAKLTHSICGLANLTSLF